LTTVDALVALCDGGCLAYANYLTQKDFTGKVAKSPPRWSEDAAA